jgi:putative PIN family toxin of toxin-antitoxin system
MLKVVLDTNIFVSSLLSKAGSPAMVIDTWRAGQYLLVISPSIISEIKRVVETPEIRKNYGLSHNEIERLILLLEKDAIVVPGLSAVAGAIPKDPADEMFLAAALDAKADLIVSGDRHLLDLGEYKDIPIFTVRQFLEFLDNQ